MKKLDEYPDLIRGPHDGENHGVDMIEYEGEYVIATIRVPDDQIMAVDWMADRVTVVSAHDYTKVSTKSLPEKLGKLGKYICANKLTVTGWAHPDGNLYAFDLWGQEESNGPDAFRIGYYDWPEMLLYCKNFLGLETMPEVYRGPFNLDKIVEASNGKPLVVRPYFERVDPDHGRILLEL